MNKKKQHKKTLLDHHSKGKSITDADVTKNKKALKEK